jgi:hypothetical protein
MKENPDGFEVISLPKTRRAISDMLREGQRKHMVHGLMEVPVTKHSIHHNLLGSSGG